MRRHFDRLWREAGGTGPAPGIDSRVIRDRVNAALGRETGERRTFMRHKVRILAIAALVTALLAGSALAVGNWNVLSAYFQGDTAPASPLLDETVRRVEDENYTLTVESSASDGKLALLLLRVEAKNQETADFLNSDGFNSIDTWSLHVVDAQAPAGGGNGAPAVSGFSYGEVEERRTETSRTWRMSADLVSASGAMTAQVRLGYMEEGLKVTVPLSYVEPVTVDIGAEGPGMGSLFQLEGGPVAVEQVTLSPFYLGVTYRCLDSGDPDRADVPLFFLFQDGTLLTRAQLVETGISGHQRGKGNWEYSFRLRSVLDVETLEAVVFNHMAYPLDGGEPYAYQVDESLQTFQLPLMEPLSEETGYSVPVQALCEGLGASYVWDGDAQSAAMVYRDVEIVLTVGSTTALVDGQSMELHAAPALQGDTLLCEYFPFEAWHIDMCAAYGEYTSGGEHNVREAWLIIP